MADSVKIKIVGDASDFNNTLSNVGQSAGSVFKGIMGSQIVTAGMSALTNGFKAAMTTGMQFEASMSQVAAISGATGAELELLTETAKHYGETTMFSASQAAEALNYMALAGWDTQQSVDALGGVLDLAAASGMELGAASDAVTDYLSAFSMEASQAGYMADLMAYAQSKSNTTASMLADAYGNCASTMHAGGQDIETTTAMLMALANQGIKGSEAGTQMSAVMRDLTQKMENGKVMIGDTAVAVQDAQGNFRDLNDIMSDVGKATEGMGTAEKSAALMETFTARSVKAVNTILNEGIDSVNQYEEALRGSEGTAAEQAKVMMDNLQGDIKIFQSALEGVQITASESMNSVARSIVQEGTGFLDAINQGGKTGGIGGMFDAVIDQIPALLPKAVTGVEKLISGIGSKLPGLVKSLISTIPSILSSAGDLVPGLITSLTDAAAAAAEGLITNLPDILGSVISAVPDILGSAVNGAANIADSILNALGIIDTRFTKYEDLGKLTGKLTYAVDVETEVSYAEAQAEIDSQLNSFVAELEGYGLTTEQVAQVLAFKGTEAELDAWLQKNFPDLDAAARNAIKAKFTAGGEGGLAGLFTEGEKFGLTAEEIAGILVDTEGMDEAGIQSYLEKNFPNLDEAAKNAITAKLPEGGWQESLKAQLEGKGIKPEDIAAILTATAEGDTSTVESILTEKYAGIKDEVEAAIKAAIPEGGLGDSLVSELTDLGIQPADIVEILTAQAEGDTDTVESLLTEKYAGIKDQARAALQKAWEAGGELSSGAEKGSATWITQLFEEMFTDGKADTQESVDAGLETAKGIIDAKIQALRDYIAQGGGDTEGAQALIDQWAGFGEALEGYATEFAGKSTAECQAAAQDILGLADTVDKATARILANSRELQSMEGNMFQLGANGTQLSSEDISHANNYIFSKLNSDREAAEQALEEAKRNAKTAEDYDKAQAEYDEAMAKALANSAARVAQLAKGQAANIEGLDVAGALNGVREQLAASVEANGGTLFQSDLEQMLRDAGYGDDIIGKAIQTVFGEQTYSGDITIGDLEGHDFGEELNRSITEYLNLMMGEPVNASSLAEELRGQGYGDDIIDQVLSELFSPENMSLDNFNLEDLLGNMDFGQLGSLVLQAINNGLIDGLSTEGLDDNQVTELVHQTILDILGGKYDLPPVETEALVDTTVTEGETDTSGLTEGVESAVEEAVEGGEPLELQEDANVSAGDVDTAELEEGIQEAVDGADTETDAEALETKRDINVVPGDVNTEELDTGIQEAAGSAGGESETTTESVSATADINVTIGAVTVDGETDIGAAIGEQLSGQTAPVTVDVSATIGTVTADGDTNIGDTIIPSPQTASPTVDVNATIGMVTADGASSLGDTIIPSPQTASPTVDVTADVGSVTVSGAEAIGATVDSNAASGNTGSALSSATSSAVSGAITSGTSAASGASSIGSGIDSAAAGGLSGSSLSGAAGSAVRGAISAANTAASGAASIGAAIAAGIARGINSNTGMISSAARAAAEKALAAAKNQLGVASPSKEMAKVGRWYDLGFAQGITSNTGAVVREAVRMSRRVAGAINTPAPMDLSVLQSGLGSTLQGFADMEAGRPIVLNLNGREVGRVMAADNAMAQNALNRHISMGYGTR